MFAAAVVLELVFEIAAAVELVAVVLVIEDVMLEGHSRAVIACC